MWQGSFLKYLSKWKITCPIFFLLPTVYCSDPSSTSSIPQLIGSWLGTQTQIEVEMKLRGSKGARGSFHMLRRELCVLGV